MDIAVNESNELDALEGKVFWQGDEGYEDARGAAVWRANKPNRYPKVIVVAESAAEVAIAVRHAAKHGLKVGVRSGGHSWTSPHLRDGAMLIDVSRLNSIDVDTETRHVWVGPGAKGEKVNDALKPHGLIVPTGHHSTVAVGGFLMCGGFGWNSRLWGNGCAQIAGVEVVTAQGEIIYADEHTNRDFWWAVRGSGAGYFGVVTRFRLTAHPLPAVMKSSVYVYPADVLEELLTWAREIANDVPPFVELVITSTAHDPDGNWAPVRLTLSALAITNTDEQADEALAMFERCPVVDRATKRKTFQPTNLTERYVSGTAADPVGYRYACDNLYTNAPAGELIPRMRELFTSLPTPRSHVFWFNWGPVKPLGDLVLSVQGDIYLGAYSIWSDPSEDAAMDAWPVEQMRKLEDLSAGGQMNDENMLARPDKYLSDEVSDKLERLRAQHDPNGVFLSFLTAETR
ncbi:FAD-binding oxidoreductase [Caballeronia sp. LP006]|uniref:FAD-binding oxidoreductase n=1 Tax=Caballeronia sp. LP006 TaxID=3038552 RepID=UPI002864CB56|nr:FAD-binding oxidoreductase [Caballeronia sp. LP006]MDR5832229.1 FAD-binding oxidoreductase [Caballeronia sp. LP006]